MQIVPELSHSIIIERNKNLYISSKNNTPPPKKKILLMLAKCHMPLGKNNKILHINKTKQNNPQNAYSKPKFQSFRNLDKPQHTNTLIQVPNIVPKLSHSIIIECNTNLYISSKNNTPPKKRDSMLLNMNTEFPLNHAKELYKNRATHQFRKKGLKGFLWSDWPLE